MYHIPSQIVMIRRSTKHSNILRSQIGSAHLYFFGRKVHKMCQEYPCPEGKALLVMPSSHQKYKVEFYSSQTDSVFYYWLRFDYVILKLILAEKTLLL